MDRPPFPGPPPWWPNVWIVSFGFHAAGIVAAVATGYRWSTGLMASSCVVIVLTLVMRWRAKRWLRRQRAFADWLNHELAEGRTPPFEIRVEKEI